MSKELPYFKFIVGDWLAGDITMCEMEIQGLFINICAYYWNKKGSICLANVKQRFSKHISLLEQLIFMKIIKLDEDENIIINFLDEQLNEFNELSEKRKNAGSLGGKASAKQRLSKSKQMLSKPQALREDKIREDNIYKYNEFYDNEIKLSNNNETYIQFVKILFGENDFKRPLNAVLKLQEQCSWKQFDTLLKYKKDYNISIRKIIEDMEGWKDIRKNKTLVGTFRTFVKRNYAKKD